MRAVRYHGPGRPFELEQVPSPQAAPGQVLVKIEAAGMCHTELHFESGLLNLGVAPVTMGHEIAGTIAAVGAGVDRARVGERVIVYYYVGCGECEWCRQGQENLCGTPRAELGFFNDGGYAEYVAVPARNAVPLPASISPEEAAPIGCGVATAVHACSLAGVDKGDVVVVYGVGAVGFGLIQLARLRGARVLAIGRTPGKLEHARDLGAEPISAVGGDVVAAVRKATDGRGADVVFELVAEKSTMEASMAMLAKHGRLVFIGYSQDPLVAHPIQLVIMEARVLGSVGNTLEELEEAVRLVAGGKVRVAVDRVLPLDDWADGLDALRNREVIGRVVLRP